MSRGYVYLATPVNNKGEYLLDYYTHYPYDLTKGLYAKARKYGSDLHMLAYQACFNTAKVRQYLWSSYCRADQPMSHGFTMNDIEAKALITKFNTELLDSQIPEGIVPTSLSMDDLLLSFSDDTFTPDIQVFVINALLARLRSFKTRIAANEVGFKLEGFTTGELILRYNYLYENLTDLKVLGKYISNNIVKLKQDKLYLSFNLHPLNITREVTETSKPFMDRLFHINYNKLIDIINDLRYDDSCPFFSEGVINRLKDKIFKGKE